MCVWVGGVGGWVGGWVGGCLRFLCVCVCVCGCVDTYRSFPAFGMTGENGPGHFGSLGMSVHGPKKRHEKISLDMYTADK